MDHTTVAATVASLIARVETLTAENARLTAINNDAALAVQEVKARVAALNTENARLKAATAVPAAPVNTYRKRPPVMRGRTVQVHVGCGPLYITMNDDEQGRPFEVFFKLGKSGSCQQSYLEALAVAISVGLRNGADPQKFIDKFEGMRCPNPRMRDASGPSTLSCADGISQGIAKALALALPIEGVDDIRPEATILSIAEPRPAIEPDPSLPLVLSSNGNGNGSARAALRHAISTGAGLCPKCGGNLVSRGGCIQCIAECGYVGKCG